MVTAIIVMGFIGLLVNSFHINIRCCYFIPAVASPTTFNYDFSVPIMDAGPKL